MTSARSLTALPGCDESKAATQDTIDQVGPTHSSGTSLKQQSLSDLFTIEYPNEYTSTVSTRVSNALLAGEVIGQVVIGLTCDYLGRKTAIVFTTFMIVIGGILATASHGVTINGMFWMMTVARGVVGFGAGGEYPASSTSASEAANDLTPKHRGPAFIMVTNFPLSFGGPFAVSIFLIVLLACQQSHYSTVWRVCFGIGCIWPLSVFYFRIRMLNSVLYRRGAIKKHVPYMLVLRYYWKLLIGTCGAWFLYDFVTFPNGVFSAILCDLLGRKPIMMIGFSGYLIFGLIIGCAYDRITKIVPLFVVFYGLMQSSGNFGPGNMLGLISSESYATGVRGTCYGLSAAVGKAGAAVGTQAFQPIKDRLGNKWTFIIADICGIVRILVTLFFVPDLTGEDLRVRDEKFRAYLVSNGWDGDMGEDDLKAAADQVMAPGLPNGDDKLVNQTVKG
ncbi:hypothetical protein HAV15_006202 [Penicillium sp. str. |nr:hypothetical protein HAV15_006202 [Penicillium sp. str. \